MSASCRELSILRFIAITVPLDGAIFVLVDVEVYLDESEGQNGRRIMCVAGYLFERRAAELLSQEWDVQLARFGLPYFHMVECAHGNGIFSGISKDDRISLQTELIKIANNYAAAGFAATTLNDEYPAMQVFHPFGGGQYTFNVVMCLTGVRTWVDITQYPGRIAYFFENGNSHQSEANRIMNTIFEHEEGRERFRYASHAFIPKEKNPPVQAADLLAWQSYTDRRHTAEGRPRRKDYDALLAPNRIVHQHWEAEPFVNRIVDLYVAGKLPIKPDGEPDEG